MVHNGSVGAWRDDQNWRVSQLSQIGAPDSDDAFAFGTIVGVALDDLGRIWVADGQQQSVHVYDEQGSLIRSVGRKGRGPGEFRSIAGLTRGADDRLWVLDFGNARFSVFDTTGTLVATHPRNTNVTVAPWPGRFDEQARLYDLASIPVPQGGNREALIRFDTELQPIDTFALPHFQPEYVSGTTQDGANRSVNQVVLPFSAAQVWAVDPKGQVWVATTDRYQVRRYGFDGSIEQVIEREHTPVLISAADRTRMISLVEEQTRMGGRIDASKLPRTMPALNSFFFDDAGNAWVMPSHSHEETSPFDVFRPSGEYLGRVRSPVTLLSAPAPVVRGDRVVGVTTDEDGVQSIVILKLEKPAA